MFGTGLNFGKIVVRRKSPYLSVTYYDIYCRITDSVNKEIINVLSKRWSR